MSRFGLTWRVWDWGESPTEPAEWTDAAYLAQQGGYFATAAASTSILGRMRADMSHIFLADHTCYVEWEARPCLKSVIANRTKKATRR